MWRVRVVKTETEGYIMKSSLKEITEEEARLHPDMAGERADGNTPEPTQIPDGAVIDLWANININKGYVNFRKEASKRGDLIDRLNSDSKVWVYTVRTVEGERWYKVRYNNKDGYIVEQYVKLMSPEESDKYQNNLPSPKPTQTLKPENGSCEHSYKYNYENDQYHYLKCSQCGDRQQHQEHNGTATCTQKAQCTNCGKEYGEPLGHNWSDAWEKDSTNHWKKCTRCGEKKEKAAHIGGTATCTEQAVCAVCGEKYGSVDTGNGHAWSDEWEKDEEHHWHKCTRTGCVEKTAKASHTFGAWDDGERSCTVCNYVEKCEHHGGTATCTEKATCDVCGHSYGKLREHDLVQDPREEPTCTKSGKEAGEHCKKCDYKKGGEEIPATGHNYENGKCSNCSATDPNQKPTEPSSPPGDNGGTGDTSAGGENPSGLEDSTNDSASSILDKRLAELEEIIRSYREA